MTTTSGAYPNIDLNPTQVFDISPDYLEAVDKARFVRICGLAALGFSLLTLLNVAALRLTWLNLAVSVGVGLFIIWHDNDGYYRILGVVALVVASMLFPALSPLVLSFAVFWKGREALADLAEEEGSEDWPLTFRRAQIGTIASAIGLGVNCLTILLPIVLGLLALAIANQA